MRVQSRHFGPDRPHPPHAERVGVQGPDRGEDDLHAFGPEHLVERAGELGIAVVDQEPQGPSVLVQGHGQVLGLLADPGRVGVGCRSPRWTLLVPSSIHSRTYSVFSVMVSTPRKAHAQVPGRLRAQELALRRTAPGSRTQTPVAEQGGDRCGGDPQPRASRARRGSAGGPTWGSPGPRAGSAREPRGQRVGRPGEWCGSSTSFSRAAGATGAGFGTD
jgi:hypothetical protein